MQRRKVNYKIGLAVSKLDLWYFNLPAPHVPFTNYLLWSWYFSRVRRMVSRNCTQCYCVLSKIYLSYLIDEVAELWDSGIFGVFCISPAQRDSYSIQRNWRKIIFCYIKSIAFSAYLKSLRLTS